MCWWFDHSDFVTDAAGFTWDLDHLDKWLADPKGFLPGTKMTFAGVKDAGDRRDLVIDDFRKNRDL